MTQTPLTVVSPGVAYFSGPINHPLDVVDQFHGGRPPIASADYAFLTHGAGRTGYGFARMAARAPGNEDSLIMVLPADVAEWYRLSVLNNNSRYLADGIVFNPPGEKRIHILPPRDVERKVSELAVLAGLNRELAPALTWARAQLRDPRVKRAAEYWLAAAQVQAITTRVVDMPSALNDGFVRGLNPEVKYTFLHPSKSMTAPRPPGGRPLFGHELLQALLTEGGRGDLAGWVVASGGYWLDSTVWNRQRIRVRFVSSGSEEAVSAAKRAVGGIYEGYELVSITGEVGASAVFVVQWGGCYKNLLANLTSLAAFAVIPRFRTAARPNYVLLRKSYDARRDRLVDEAEDLATRAMRHEGLVGENDKMHFFPEIIEDIMACTTLNWPALFHEAHRLQLLSLDHKVGSGCLSEGEMDAIRRGIITFVNTAPESHFGTTNMTVAIAYGLATILAKAGLIHDYHQVFDRREVVIPEGIRSMPFVRERFSDSGLPEEFASAIDRFRPLWGS